MDETNIDAYIQKQKELIHLQIIDMLLSSSDAQRSEVLAKNKNKGLIDEGFLQTAKHYAQKLQEDGDKQAAAYLLELVQQSTQTTNLSALQTRQQEYIQLIQELLQRPNDKKNKIINANRELIDSGLIETMQKMAEEFDKQENSNGKWLSNIAQKLSLYLLNSQSNSSQLNFLFEILRTISLGASQHEIYHLFQQNLDQINLKLCQALQIWTDSTLKTLEPEQKQSIGYDIFELSNLIQQFSLGNRAINLEIAISGYKILLTIFIEADFSQQWVVMQSSLGSAYIDRIAGDRKENLEAAITAYNLALRVYTEADFPQQWAMTQNNLGIAYKERIAGDRKENIEQAITAYTYALRVYTEADFPQQWAMTQNNLGIAYSGRIAGNRRENLEQAIIHYQNALTISTPQANPIECLKTARSLGNLALEQKRWQLAIDAYSQAIEAVEISREAAGSEARKQEILSKAISVYVNMARACIQDGQYTKGIEYLERSKTRNLIDLLANSQMYPRGVSQQIIDSLDALRRNIIVAERRLQQQKTEECFNRLSSLRQSMEYLISKHIQPKDPGFQLSQRVEPISFAQIQAALPTPQTALIEWCVSKDTLAVFIVTKHQTQPLVITSDFEEVQTLEKIKGQYLSKYRERKDKWQERLILFLYQLAQTLDWDKIIKSLKQALPDCNKVILVPHRWLHIIPIHALPLKDGSCLLDRFPQGVSYAPSVQLFELTQKLSHPNLQNFFAVQNPTQDLRFTDIEVESIGSQFQPHDDIIKHQEAHRLALTKERLSKANCTHFSCHGEFNFEKPERSALLLAGSKVEQQDSDAEERTEARFMPSRDGVILT